MLHDTEKSVVFRGALGRLLRWLNLRPEESDRTLLMFAVYTTTSIGLLWLEASTVALFLEELGAQWLPLIYIGSALLGGVLGILSTWMQKVLPLRRFIVAIALMIAAPLLLFRLGLEATAFSWLTVFLLPLWVDAAYALNHLNTSLTANQLFNIREIKRTFPLISSGVLVADVLSGFSLPFLLKGVGGLPNVLLVACGMLVLGAGLFFYLSQRYQQSFPDSPHRVLTDSSQPDVTTRRLKGPLRQYAFLLFAFFVIAQVLVQLIDFQFQSQLELNFKGPEIASFLGLFTGVVGLFELMTQWFVSSRAIERVGVFRTAMLPPVVIATWGLFPLSGIVNLFIGVVILKFLDELLRYTFVASTGPVLFQPIPEARRGSVETKARGIGEPLASGFTGLVVLGLIGLLNWAMPQASDAVRQQILGTIVIGGIAIFAVIWLLSVWLLRSRYVELLVLSAQRGQLGVADVNLRVLKRAVVETLERPGSDADKSSCIELLGQIDPREVGEVLAPLLGNMSPALQRQSLEAMLVKPNPVYLKYVRALIGNEEGERKGEALAANTPYPTQPFGNTFGEGEGLRPIALTLNRLPPDVLAVALRYIWLTETEPDLSQLKPYLQSEVHPVVRGTAASLLLRLGTAKQKAEATWVLRRMLTHPEEEERVMGCRALGEAVYLQTLRLQIPKLLQDKSLRVRRAVLDAIAATRLEEYYPSLLRGLEYNSTREAALHALVRLDNEAIPMLLDLATNIRQPDLVRRYAWEGIGRIGTPEALTALVSHLMTAWGNTRRDILQILFKLPQDVGIEAALDRMGRSGVEALIDQELMFMGQMYAALIDLRPEQVRREERGVRSQENDSSPLTPLVGREADLLRRSLRYALVDAVDRCFLLMKLLYPLGAIQAAAFNLRSDAPAEMARGLEILDQTIDIPSKRVLLILLDRHSDEEKQQSLAGMVAYQPLKASDRVRHLLSLRHFLSDWSLACCFHLARTTRWNLTAEPTLACLRHPTGFVREAAIAYLKVASPRGLIEILPKLKQDPDRLVAAQVQQLMIEFGLGSNITPAT